MNRYRSNQSIAVIGMSCRFPKINNPEDFWNILFEGESVIDKVPEERWNIKDYYDPDPNAPGKTNQNVGAFLENIHHFDPYFFNISPKEAIEMNPSQKIMMELAWELFESSSLKKSQFYGSKTGVYIGNIWADFEHLRKMRKAEINNFSAIGQSSNVIANRISYHFGLTGPSLVLDTGCSSSLVSIMLAVESLRSHSSDMCMAGGVNHMLDADEYVYLAKFGGLSSKGKCSAFDADADGFVRAEGAGAVLLKRLEDAERDGDKIYAVIRGGAITNNGFNVNMPATSKEGQVEVLKQAYQDAGVLPEEVDFIEAHGTGTKLGDPVETNALGTFFSESRKDDTPLFLGSVKTNLGHCESSSGIAGMLKTILAFQHRTIPKNLNFKNPNPKIDFEGLKLRVPTDNIAWPEERKETMKAGVSSYGWGGTNVHVVLEEYQQPEVCDDVSDTTSGEYSFLPLSARTPKALLEYAGKYAGFLESSNDKSYINDICASTATQKPIFECKKLFYGKTTEDITQQLKDFQKSEAKSIKASKTGVNSKVVFVFPGQGAQWLGMGKELYAKEPAFKVAIDECEAAFKKYADWSLVQEIHATEDSSKLNRIHVIQPYLFAMQVALSRLWIAKGIEPDSVVGHSMGEVAAAYIAGTLSMDDAANIICTRSILMNTLSGQGGAMAVTELNTQQAEQLVEKYEGKISLAVQNSPKSTVLAGDSAIIEAILEDLTEKGLFCRQVKVDVASHSPQMDLIKDELFEKIKGIQPRKSSLSIYSTVRNKRMEGEDMDAEYWKCNLRNTVQFSSVTQQLLNDGHQIFIEVSPHSVLSMAIQECAEAFQFTNVSVIGSLHRENPSMEELAKNFGLIYESGCQINWEKFYEGYSHKYMELPTYPLQREKYEIKDLSAHFENGKGDQSVHPLIGTKLKLADVKNHYWESKISLYNLPYLAHHQVNETAVFPGGFYIEMINSAVSQVDADNKYLIHNLEFVQSIELSDQEAVNIQLKIITENDLPSGFKFFKQNQSDQSWEMVCSGNLQKDDQQLDRTFQHPKSIENKVEKNEIYNSFINLGVTFKEIFQNIENIDICEDAAYAVIDLSENDAHKPEHYSIPPMLLDNCLHPLFTKAFTEIDDDTIKTTFVQGIEQIKIGNVTSNDHLFYVKTKLYPIQADENKLSYSILGDICVYDSNHKLILEMNGAKAKIIDTRIERTESTDSRSVNVLDAVMMESNSLKRKELIEEYLINLVADASKASPDQLDVSMTFKDMGIDSLTTVQLRNIIEKQFKVKLSIKSFYEFPSIAEFSGVLIGMLQFQSENTESLSVNPSDKWLSVPKPNKEAAAILFLFHDAGGNIRLFENWDAVVDSSLELVMIQLPGRDDRSGEPLSNNLDEVLKELLPVMNDKIDKPFHVYGHSMGGLVAFEAVRRLEHEFGKRAENLMISGTPCLKGFVNHFVNNIFDQNYSDEQLLSLITSESKVQLDINDVMVQELIKTLRSDFELIYNYSYKEMSQLGCRITAIHAKNDDRVNIEDVKRWDTETSHEFDLICVEGGHNFVYSDADATASLINEITMKFTTIEKM